MVTKDVRRKEGHGSGKEMCWNMFGGGVSLIGSRYIEFMCGTVK